MGHKQSKQSNKGSRQPKPRKLHPPKHMLWGCTTPEEHYAYIDDVCDRVKELKGEEGLKLMGFEYRTLHNPETCVCRDEMIVDDDEQVGLDAWDEEKEGDAKEEDDVVGDIGECYMVPIGMSLKEHERLSGSFMMESTMERLSSRSRDRDNTDDDDGEGSDGSPNSIRLGASLSIDENGPSSPFSSSSSPSNRLSKRQRPVSRATSNVSLFSLATHNSSDISQTEDEECALRLYHVPSGSTLISSQNHQTFIAGGRMYDEVCRLCMEYAQDVMIKEGNLNWVSVCDERNIQALVSRSRKMEECHSDNNKNNQSQKRKKKVLLIITGKGKVRAGIFSRRHLVTTGAEAATAIPLVREAKRRDMDVVILDPNARGDKLGMDTVTTSLEHLFFRRQQTVDVNNDDDANKVKEEEEEDIYVLAHSMAGAQLVRFLHDTSSSTTKASAASSSSKDNTAQEAKAVTTTRIAQSASSFLRKIKAIAFTDSNHSIQWTRKTNPKLTNLLVGPKCLYVKSHKLHDDERKYPGEAHHECQFWHHRFGTIRTIWAGTHEHSLTNHTARFHIWDHFDSFGSSYF